MAEDSGVWVYAVAEGIEHEWLEGGSGVGGRPVRALQAAGLAAAVSAVPMGEYGEEALRLRLEDIAWLEAVARMHHGVIETIARRRPVVPMRLATVFHSEAGVAAMLAARHDELIAALGRIEGRIEWGVKVYAAPRPATAANSAAGPAPPSSPGAAYLRRRRMELSAREDARRDAIASAEDIHSSLRRVTVAAQLRAAQDPQLSGQAEPMVLNGAYLVQDALSGVFVAAVHSLAEQHRGVRVELTGPWPAYSFAAVDELGTAV